MEGERDHTVIHGNEQFSDSDQRDIPIRQVVVEPAGQPTAEYEGWKHFDVCIEQSVASYLCALADGDLSEGVRIAMKFHQARRKNEE
jgi:hypothetical protein